MEEASLIILSLLLSPTLTLHSQQGSAMLSFITLPLLAALAAARPISRAINDGPVAAAWFQGWSSDYTVNNVPWDKYTHVTYSFACAHTVYSYLLLLANSPLTQHHHPGWLLRPHQLRR